MTVEEMLNRISSRELIEWMAYDQVEPIGNWRSDLQNAMLCTLIANVNRDPDIKPEPFEPVDFIIDFWKPREAPIIEKPSWQRNKALAEMLTIALGGKDLRK